MQTITITLPDTAELDARQTVKFFASKLYEAGKVAFAEILGDFGVSLINYPVTEMKRDAEKI